MTLPPETAERLTQPGSALDQRVIRVRFESEASLLDGFALAQEESWIEDCEVHPGSLELVIRMAGGFWIEPGEPPAPLRARSLRHPRARPAPMPVSLPNSFVRSTT